MNNLNKLRERIYPLTLIVIGIYIVILPYVFRIDLNISFEILVAIAQIFILIGILMYGYQEVKRRLSRIENELEIDKDNRLSKAKLISADISNDFINEIKRKHYIYKASIYLPNAEMNNLFLIQNLLSNTKIDSKVRLVINSSGDEVSQNNIKSIENKFKEKVDLRLTRIENNKHFSIIIIDTDVWILNDFGKEIESNLLFSVSSYNEQGKSFIEQFNRIWEESKSE